METTWTVVISIASALSGILVAWLTFGRNRSKDAEGEGKTQGVLMTEIGYIKAGIDDIKKKQEKQDAQNFEFMVRLNEVEKKADQANARIDDHLRASKG